MKTLSENEKKNGLSEGCLQSIFCVFGYKLVKVALEDDCGIDYKLIRRIDINGKLSDLGSVLDFQLKATTNWSLSNNHITYNLRNKNYNDMVARNIHKGSKLLLILHCLPESDPWLTIHNQSIEIRDRLLWFSIDDQVFKDNPTSSTVIHIPLSNMLTQSEIERMINLWAVQ